VNDLTEIPSRLSVPFSLNPDLHDSTHPPSIRQMVGLLSIAGHPMFSFFYLHHTSLGYRLCSRSHRSPRYCISQPHTACITVSSGAEARVFRADASRSPDTEMRTRNEVDMQALPYSCTGPPRLISLAGRGLADQFYSWLERQGIHFGMGSFRLPASVTLPPHIKTAMVPCKRIAPFPPRRPPAFSCPAGVMKPI